MGPVLCLPHHLPHVMLSCGNVLGRAVACPLASRAPFWVGFLCGGFECCVAVFLHHGWTSLAGGVRVLLGVKGLHGLPCARPVQRTNV